MAETYQLRADHPSNLRSRETLEAEEALLFAFGIPYAELLAHARKHDLCEEEDLLQMGAVLFDGLRRIVRGEASSLSFPKRLPYRGEYRPIHLG